MKGIASLLGALAFVAMVQVSSTALAGEEFKNLKVLDGSNKKAVENGMKSFSKGLGVKCNACHVKGEFDSDKIEAKGAARTFLTAAVGEKDAAKRDTALNTLLTAMKLKAAKDPKAVWTGVDTFAKK